MKTLKYFLSCLVLSFIITTGAWAAFLVSNPSDATVFAVKINDGPIQEIPAQADGSLKLDISSYSGKSISGELAPGREWFLDGVPQGVMEWAPTVPFVLSGGVIDSSSSLGLKVIK